MKMFRCLSTVLFIVLFASFFFLPSQSYSQQKGATYVGSETCKGCHEDYFNSFTRSIHGKKAIKDAPASTAGCESCHGPGGVHAEKGGGKEGIIAFGRTDDPAKKMAMCMACHENGKELTSWDQGRHKTMGVSCDACHAVHSNTPRNLKATQPGLCLPCHKDLRMQINKQSRHPIQEGKVKCTDCHSPHGGFGKKSILAESTPELCYKCHADKRGPFVYEHAPVNEDCGYCHAPHGSNQNALLVKQVPRLCSDCHSSRATDHHAAYAYTAQHGFLGAATTAKHRVDARGCLNCHGYIHGTNIGRELRQ